MRKRILVADGEVYIVHILEFSLTMEGYEVLTATSREELLRKIEEEQPDLVVLDLGLGDIDGHELCRLLRSDERHATTPVIFLHARHQSVNRGEGSQAGVCSYMTKPFSPQQLIEEIQAALSCNEGSGEQAVGM